MKVSACRCEASRDSTSRRSPSSFPQSLASKSACLVSFALQRSFKQLVDLLPTLGRHRELSGAISRYSQAFAFTHSRLTVAGDTARTSAVSSMLNPPK